MTAHTSFHVLMAVITAPLLILAFVMPMPATANTAATVNLTAVASAAAQPHERELWGGLGKVVKDVAGAGLNAAVNEAVGQGLKKYGIRELGFQVDLKLFANSNEPLNIDITYYDKNWGGIIFKYGIECDKQFVIERKNTGGQQSVRVKVPVSKMKQGCARSADFTLMDNGDGSETSYTNVHVDKGELFSVDANARWSDVPQDGLPTDGDSDEHVMYGNKELDTAWTHGKVHAGMNVNWQKDGDAQQNALQEEGQSVPSPRPGEGYYSNMQGGDQVPLASKISAGSVGTDRDVSENKNKKKTEVKYKSEKKGKEETMAWEQVLTTAGIILSALVGVVAGVKIFNIIVAKRNSAASGGKSVDHDTAEEMIPPPPPPKKRRHGSSDPPVVALHAKKTGNLNGSEWV